MCYAINCKSKVPEPRMFCKEHWDLLTWGKQMDIADAWFPDDERKKLFEYELFMACVEAVSEIGLSERTITHDECEKRRRSANRTFIKEHGEPRPVQPDDAVLPENRLHPRERRE